MPTKFFSWAKQLMISFVALVVIMVFSIVTYNLISQLWSTRQVSLELTARERLDLETIYTFSEGTYQLTFLGLSENSVLKIAVNDQFYSQDSLLEPLQITVEGPSIIRVIKTHYIDVYITSVGGGTMIIEDTDGFGKSVMTLLILVLWAIIMGVTVFSYQRYFRLERGKNE